MSLKINRQTKYFKVTEVHMLSNGSVRLVLADGRDLNVRRRDGHSYATVSQGDREEDGHCLKVSDLHGTSGCVF